MHTVIVVDDHPAIRLAVRSAPRIRGEFQVVGEAGDGPTALAAIRDQRPDLVILDLDLPRLSGLDLIERVRKSLPSTKLLVLSAQPESIFAARTVQAGANGFMSKSEDMSAVAQAARTVLAGYSMFPSSALGVFARTRPFRRIARCPDEVAVRPRIDGAAVTWPAA